MSITIEVGYFNSFYVKRIADIAAPVGPIAPITLPDTSATPYPWVAPSTSTVEEDWYIEESRIRGGYNNTSIDLGVKAYIVEDNDQQQRRFSSIIYSGIFNSRTGVNQWSNNTLCWRIWYIYKSRVICYLRLSKILY